MCHKWFGPAVLYPSFLIGVLTLPLPLQDLIFLAVLEQSPYLLIYHALVTISVSSANTQSYFHCHLILVQLHHRSLEGLNGFFSFQVQVVSIVSLVDVCSKNSRAVVLRTTISRCSQVPNKSTSQSNLYVQCFHFVELVCMQA